MTLIPRLACPWPSLGSSSSLARPLLTLLWPWAKFSTGWTETTNRTNCSYRSCPVSCSTTVRWHCRVYVKWCLYWRLVIRLRPPTLQDYIATLTPTVNAVSWCFASPSDQLRRYCQGTVSRSKQSQMMLTYLGSEQYYNFDTAFSSFAFTDETRQTKLKRRASSRARAVPRVDSRDTSSARDLQQI